MVRNVVTGLTGLLFACLLVLGTCRQRVYENNPRIRTALSVSDTAQFIGALPASGPVNVSKNGYRVFELDSMVEDGNDSPATITWTLSPDALLTVDLDGHQAKIGPVPNLTGRSYVVFTATDPSGLSASRTCSVSVFDEFAFDTLPKTVFVRSGQGTSVDLRCRYRTTLESSLQWVDTLLFFDNTYLDDCSLAGVADSGRLTVTARDSVVGTTAVQFFVYDPVNHVYFSHSFPVVVQ
jgi:hypothetical protein